ncbi:Non-specific serine/threonine protein kinase [Bertholletia excelsa]
MENGSLYFHLFKGKSLLTWTRRYGIAKGLAAALLYLHEEWEKCVVHRDVKSSNVMLDSNFNSRLGDFGLARLFDHEKEPETTAVAGTLGYVAPEICMVTGKSSKESDVYSFGIVALKIACGRRAIDRRVEESQVNLLQCVCDLYGLGKLLEAADARLADDFDQQEMERLMIVGLWCAHPDYSLRPSIRQAVNVLNFEASLPVLPAKLPVATYLSPAPSPTLYHDTTFSESSQGQSSSYTHNTGSSHFSSASAASSSAVSLLHPKIKGN